MRSWTPAVHYSITPLAVLPVSMIHNDLTIQHSNTPSLHYSIRRFENEDEDEKHSVRGHDSPFVPLRLCSQPIQRSITPQLHHSTTLVGLTPQMSVRRQT